MPIVSGTCSSVLSIADIFGSSISTTVILVQSGRFEDSFNFTISKQDVAEYCGMRDCPWRHVAHQEEMNPARTTVSGSSAHQIYGLRPEIVVLSALSLS